MMRLILTFETMFQVLAADKLLRERMACRPTPTPAGLSDDICGMALELMDPATEGQALELLAENGNIPKGVYHL